MIISDTFAAMGTLAIALLLWSGRLEIWHIYISTTISSMQARFRDRHFWRQLLKLRPNSILDRQTE